MNIPTYIYQPSLYPDDLVTARLALDQRAQWAEKMSLTVHTRHGYEYFAREARLARRLHDRLLDAPTVDLDDMERHATR